MITYVNSENARKYSVLFDKASEALNQQTIDAGIELNDSNTVEISSLAEYFENIKTLTLIDKKYTILPVDEGVFSIDANQRSIEVPADFKKNGIGVQGDEIAEILYFKIARYFDATDLNETEIYIQWEAPDGTKGLSKEWVRDVESEPGYIIFGWPICSDITKQAGDVKFAVRFYKILTGASGEKFLAYSFGTLTQTVAVKPSLDFDILLDPEELNEIVHDHEEFIKIRMVNSDPQDSYATPAEDPVYTLNLSGHPYEGSDAAAVVSAPEVWQNLVDGHLILHVQATSPDAGVITYNWYKLGNLSESLNGVDEYIEVPAPAEGEDRTLSTAKPYYTRRLRPGTEDEYAYSLYTGEEYPLEGALYERVSKLDVTATGKYYAVANNRVGSSNAELESNLIEVPYPATPLLDGDGIALVGEDAIPVLDDGVSVEALLQPIDGEAAIKPHQGELTYEWRYHAPNAENIAEVDPEAEVAVISGQTGRVLPLTAANDEGFYSVIAKNSLNGEREDSVESALVRITRAPQEIVILQDDLGIENYSGVARVGSTLVVSLAETQPNHDAISYQWFKAIGEASDEDDIAIEGATTNTITAGREGGTFYCIVTNTYNGQTKKAKSPIVTVASAA